MTIYKVSYLYSPILLLLKVLHFTWTKSAVSELGNERLISLIVREKIHTLGHKEAEERRPNTIPKEKDTTPQVTKMGQCSSCMVDCLGMSREEVCYVFSPGPTVQSFSRGPMRYSCPSPSTNIAGALSSPTMLVSSQQNTPPTAPSRTETAQADMEQQGGSCEGKLTRRTRSGSGKPSSRL